jgi:hypothetical protein
VGGAGALLDAVLSEKEEEETLGAGSVGRVGVVVG